MAMSEKLIKMMQDDHKERMQTVELWIDTSASLMRKLDERDMEIKRLQSEMAALKAASGL